MEVKISFNPFLLPLEIFLKPSFSFQTWMVSILPSHRWFKGLIKGKVPLRCGRKRAPSDSITLFSLFEFLFLHNLCVLLLFWVSLIFMLCLILHGFVCFQFCLFIYFFLYKNNNNKLKNQKNTKTMCVIYTLVLVYLGWPLKQSFLNFVSLET